MKKSLLATLACLFIMTGLFAQDCTHYLYMQKDKTIEMTGFNKKGDVTMKSVSKVSDVSTADGTTTAMVDVEIFDKNGKSMGTSTMECKCNGSSFSMQMHFTADQKSKQPTNMNIKVNGSGAEDYPSDMKVGDHLKDYTSQIQMFSGTTSTVKVTDRIVEAKENLTTPAGTWECFKISYKSSITTAFTKSTSDTVNKVVSIFNKLGIKQPANTNTTTAWYVPGLAVVKTETKTGYYEITGIK